MIILSTQVLHAKGKSSGIVIGDSYENIQNAIIKEILENGVPKAQLKSSQISKITITAVKKEFKNTKISDVRNEESQYEKLLQVLTTENKFIENKIEILNIEKEENLIAYKEKFGILERTVSSLAHNEANEFYETHITPLVNEIKALEKSIKKIEKAEGNILDQVKFVLKNPLMADMWNYLSKMEKHMKEHDISIKNSGDKAALLKTTYNKGTEESASLTIKLYEVLGKTKIPSQFVPGIVDSMVKRNLGVDKVEYIKGLYQSIHDSKYINYEDLSSVLPYIISMNISLSSFEETILKIKKMHFADKNLIFLSIGAHAKGLSSELELERLQSLYIDAKGRTHIGSTYAGLVALQMILNNKTIDQVDQVEEFFNEVKSLVPNRSLLAPLFSVGISKGLESNLGLIRNSIDDAKYFRSHHTHLTEKDFVKVVQLYLATLSKHQAQYEQHLAESTNLDQINRYHDESKNLLEMYIWYSIYTSVLFDAQSIETQFEVFNEDYTSEIEIDQTELTSNDLDADLSSNLDMNSMDIDFDADMDFASGFDIDIDLDLDIDFDVDAGGASID